MTLNEMRKKLDNDSLEKEMQYQFKWLLEQIQHRGEQDIQFRNEFIKEHLFDYEPKLHLSIKCGSFFHDNQLERLEKERPAPMPPISPFTSPPNAPSSPKPTTPHKP